MESVHGEPAARGPVPLLQRRRAAARAAEAAGRVRRRGAARAAARAHRRQPAHRRGRDAARVPGRCAEGADVGRRTRA